MSQLMFTPQKFTTLAGQVYTYVIDANGSTLILQYGGPTNVAYDNCVATVTMPWFDLGSVEREKQANSIDYAIQGSWVFSGSMDYIGVTTGGGVLQVINTDSQPSFQSGDMAWSDTGYHVQLSASTTGATPAILSSIIFHYTDGKQEDETP